MKASTAISKTTPERIAEWCQNHMAYYKAPGWIALVEDLPLTATEKIQRGEIRTIVAEIRANGTAHDLRHLKRRT